MGCASSSLEAATHPVPQSVTPAQSDDADQPLCVLCNKRAEVPFSRVKQSEWQAARDAWASYAGAPAHRACAVAARLAEARAQKERREMGRAKQAVYPAPSSLVKRLLRRISSSREWDDASFRSSYRCPSSLAELDAAQQQGQAAAAASAAHTEQLRLQMSARGLDERLEDEVAIEVAQTESLLAGCSPAGGSLHGGFALEPVAEDASLATEPPTKAPATELGMPSEHAAQRAPARLGAARLSSSSRESEAWPPSSMGASSEGSSGRHSPTAVVPGGRGASAPPPKLRRPSPMKGPALFEAKRQRKAAVAGPGSLSFDAAAMSSDADGCEGKAWRLRMQETPPPAADPFSFPF
eukprot:scaffold20.g7839.t1